MNYRPYCIPCFLRRTLHTAQIATADEWLHRKVLGEIMGDLTAAADEATPAEMIHQIFRRTARTLGMADPYQNEKKRWREETLSNTGWIRERVDATADPFFTALKLAVAANRLDNELRPILTLRGLVEGLDEIAFEPENLEAFRDAVGRATKVLYVHDTAGELFFDRLFIEKMGKPREAISSIVRQQPVFADATRADAEAIDLSEVVGEVIDPGIDCLGLPLGECSEACRERVVAADLVVVKGQAGYQTLEGQKSLQESGKEVFFLLSVKCPVMASHLGVGLGDLVLERG